MRPGTVEPPTDEPEGSRSFKRFAAPRSRLRASNDVGSTPQHAIKRACDTIAASTGLIVAAPLLGIVGAVVLVKMGRPILLQQRRPGKDGMLFTLYKFRTMTEDVDAAGRLLSDSDRITRVGSWLRRWSIDELPELWNVVKGDMSLVGPRPLLVEYLDLYNEEEIRRHEMRPGLTGLAQISGRNDQTWAVRLALDVWYVDHWSLWLDARIIAKTAARVLTGDGISHPEHATMNRFEGSRHV